MITGSAFRVTSEVCRRDLAYKGRLTTGAAGKFNVTVPTTYSYICMNKCKYVIMRNMARVVFVPQELHRSGLPR